MKPRIQASLSIKLIFSLVSVVLIIGSASITIGLRIINNNIVGQAYEQVQNDLKTAHYIYEDKIQIINLFMRHLSLLAYLHDAVEYNDRRLLVNKLQEVKRELGLDILNIVDPAGRVIVRAGNPARTGDSVSDDKYVSYVRTNLKSCYGSDIISREHLVREGGDLANRAFIEFIPTPMARKTDATYEDRGLVLKAASPMIRDGRLIGIIYGARLINRNYDMVDQIKSLVFKEKKYHGFEYGTATIFLDDLRISTNVLREDGVRAIGTRISEEVYKKVFERGNLWLDKAFVVNTWYISAYSPIYDLHRKVIGILYVGIIEKKFNDIKRETTVLFLAIIIVTLIIAVGLSIYLIQNFLHPVNNLVNASKEIADGNYNIQIPVDSRDELGYLCKTFNSMVSAIVERDNLLKEDTQNQIVQSEKLASLGKLAAGIAHEINNPLTGVLTYSSILLEDLKDTEHKDDLEVIVNETLRCRKIVREILNFARETRIEKERSNINKVINETLSLLEKHVNFQNISIVKDFDSAVPDMEVDINQIKSVVNNLSLNASDAMPEGGTLTIRTGFDSIQNAVIVEFIDTGHGISEENIGRIFDPFFTTKQTGKGTGLGLAVTYSVIKRHNGSITVKSSTGEGTTFTIVLPVAQGGSQ
ncbi:MAG TPA: cache domain-containing protein [Spirochaetota bacterium]|nr:cache domain-containing protein [Spirochaetota bacterium]